MKYVIASIVCGLLWIGGLLLWTHTSAGGGGGAPTSVLGEWSWEDEGKTFSLVITDSYLSLEGQKLNYHSHHDGNLVVIISDSEDPAGQIPVNEIALTFKIQETDKMELLSVGIEPVKKTVLTRK